FVVINKDKSFRPILDLSILNKLLVIPSFKMETVSKISVGIVDSLWGCTLDLTSAYFHVPMGWTFQKFLAFVVDDQIYVFQYLPFGLSTGPWAFTRVIKPIKGYLHRLKIMIHSFLDDFLLLHGTQEGLREVTSVVLSLFEKLGFRVNFKKSLLTPSQTVKYL
ncbi:unnamed protein product, partial [Meganyctiphanes norvegica]